MVRRLSNRQSGLTLVELLVVLTILGFIAGVVALNVPPARSSAKAEAERFAARMQLAIAASMTEIRPYAMEVGAAGYSLKRYEKGRWIVPDDDRRFADRAMPDGVSLSATQFAVEKDLGRRADTGSPMTILLDPLGAAASFSVVFSDSRGGWRVLGNQEGLIFVERDAPR